MDLLVYHHPNRVLEPLFETREREIHLEDVYFLFQPPILL